MKKIELSRRAMLKSGVMAAAAMAVPTIIPGAVLGKDGAVAPSEKIILGGIGINNRGRYVLSNFLDQKDVLFSAIADVQRTKREQVKDMAQKTQGTNHVAMYRDFRELLERPDLDAVLIATGDHWHGHASIYAARAGKDVYSEKPCAITMELCGQLADTMKQYGTIYQGGTQRRSTLNFRYAVDMARKGHLGKLHTVHASIYYLQMRTDWYPEQPLRDREEVDWDLWLGPCPWRPFNMDYVNGAWRAHFDFDSGAKHHDWGAHTVDLCQWALDADGTTPVRYWADGHTLYAEYADGVKLVMRPDGWMGLGNCPVRFEGDEGWVETGDSGQMAVHPARLRGLYGAAVLKQREGENPRNHVRNFLDCVKTRRQPVCNADVIRSSHIACHASALSWILQRELRFDPKTETFINDDEANRMRSWTWRQPWTI